jgi:hypothetical protein
MPQLTLDAATLARYLDVIGQETRGSSGSSGTCSTKVPSALGERWCADFG